MLWALKGGPFLSGDCAGHSRTSSDIEAALTDVRFTCPLCVESGPRVRGLDARSAKSGLMHCSEYAACFVVHSQRTAQAMSVIRTVSARIAPNITKMLRNKVHNQFANSRANKNRPYVQTDIRSFRRTTRFERNDRNDV